MHYFLCFTICKCQFRYLFFKFTKKLNLNRDFAFVAPRLAESFPRKQSFNEGSRVKLLCYLESGSKPLHFEWFRNGQILREDKSLNYKIATTEDDSLLIIDRLKFNEAGNYSCFVRNDYGTDIRSMIMFVKGLNQIFSSVN